MKKLTTEEFIKKAQKIHGKFDYSKVDYKNTKTKIIIICKKHGEFLQTPSNHLYGQGCKKCANENLSMNKSYNTKKFIELAKSIHNDNYIYNKVIYKRARDKVIIICKKHGEFKQQANHHLAGHGCMKCMGENMKLNAEAFIQKAKNIHHNKYDYHYVKYVHNHSKIIIICKNHGQFSQRADQHLAGHGCSKCSNIASKPSQLWLNTLKIPQRWREKSIKIDGQLFKVDAFDEKNKIIYEFYGDFWHGNPEKFASSNINPRNKKTYGELYNNTIKREQTLKSAGYSIISIWEKEFNK